MDLIFDLAHRSLGRSIFSQPMSQHAREVLTIIIKGLVGKGQMVGGPNQILDKFVESYHPTVYEEAVMGWDSRGLCKILRNKFGGGAEKVWRLDPEEIINTALLQPLMAGQWNVVGKSYESGWFRHNTILWMEQYDYLTQKFLTHDFSDGDLRSLVEIIKRFSPQDIRKSCDRVTAADKKTIAYLHAVMTNIDRDETAVLMQTSKMLDASAEKMRSYEVIRTGTYIPKQYDPTWIDKINVIRRMQDAMLEEDNE